MHFNRHDLQPQMGQHAAKRFKLLIFEPADGGLRHPHGGGQRGLCSGRLQALQDGGIRLACSFLGRMGHCFHVNTTQSNNMNQERDLEHVLGCMLLAVAVATRADMQALGDTLNACAKAPGLNKGTARLLEVLAEQPKRCANSQMNHRS